MRSVHIGVGAVLTRMIYFSVTSKTAIGRVRHNESWELVQFEIQFETGPFDPFDVHVDVDHLQLHLEHAEKQMTLSRICNCTKEI